MPLVRYVGSVDPVEADIDKVRAAIAAGKLTVDQVHLAQHFRLGGTVRGAREAGITVAGPMAGRRNPIVTACIPGITWRELGPNEGLSKTVRWGPHLGTFVQEVSEADWEAIQRLPEGKHWQRVADRSEAPLKKPEPPPVIVKTFNVVEERERILAERAKAAGHPPAGE